MPREVRIIGEAVSLVETNVVRTVKLTDWMEALAARNPISSGIMPKGTRFFVRKAEHTVIVVEQEPAVRRIEWNLSGEAENFWQLAFPYVEFVFTSSAQGVIVDGEVFYRNSPIQSMDDTLCWPNLGNIYTNVCKICTEGMQMDGDLTIPMVTRLEDFISAFWASKFNADLLWAFNFYRRVDKRLDGLDAWQRATRENPLFPLEISWHAFKTIGSLLC